MDRTKRAGATGWSSRVKRAGLVLVGAAVGVNGLLVTVAPQRIGPTYGVSVDGPDDEVLLRHRAVMLALIGALLAASALDRRLRPAAVTAAALSMASFALFALSADVNGEQRRVALIDVALLVVLAAVVALPERAHPRATSASPSSTCS